MEELRILVEELELKEESLRNEVDALNDFGNTPEGNYYRIKQVLTEWEKVKFTLKHLKELEEAVASNSISW